jgi:hypothetical protein
MKSDPYERDMSPILPPMFAAFGIHARRHVETPVAIEENPTPGGRWTRLDFARRT